VRAARRTSSPSARALARLWRDHRPIVIGAASSLASSSALTGLVWGRCGLGGLSERRSPAILPAGQGLAPSRPHGRVFADLRPVEGATVPLRLIPKHVATPSSPSRTSASTRTEASIGGAWSGPPWPTSGARLEQGFST
jgi:hypothetical protein